MASTMAVGSRYRWPSWPFSHQRQTVQQDSANSVDARKRGHVQDRKPAGPMWSVRPGRSFGRASSGALSIGPWQPNFSFRLGLVFCLRQMRQS